MQARAARPVGDMDGHRSYAWDTEVRIGHIPPARSSVESGRPWPRKVQPYLRYCPSTGLQSILHSNYLAVMRYVRKLQNGIKYFPSVREKPHFTNFGFRTCNFCRFEALAWVRVKLISADKIFLEQFHMSNQPKLTRNLPQIWSHSL
jgi:hypothetical protein